MLRRVINLGSLLLTPSLAVAQDPLPSVASMDTLIRARVDDGWTTGMVGW